MRKTEAKSFPANVLVDDIKNGNILVPQYQRGQVWKEEQQKMLINSIKNGYPFGTILLYLNKSDGKYRLIDGLQRCTTLSKYINNPAKFFSKEMDIENKKILEIIHLVPHQTNEYHQLEKIKDIISNWVITEHNDMNDIGSMQFRDCVDLIIEEFPLMRGQDKEIAHILKEMFSNYQQECNEIVNADIPALVYVGEEKALPDIFSRINSKGTPLSKYQILAATWSHQDITITEDELLPIINYVKKFFLDLFEDDQNFKLENYDINKLESDKTINLYQLFFGFGKLLSTKYPSLFKANVKAAEVESCGFNLVAACLCIRVADISKMHENILKYFDTPQEINKVLVKILDSVRLVDKILAPYIKFKNNSRNKSNIIYHTEYQIISMIASCFIAKSINFDYDEERDSISNISINLETNNYLWKEYERNFKQNAFKRYLIDILGSFWSGSGDAKLFNILKNKYYYTKELDSLDLENALDNWFNSMNARNETSRIASVGQQEKLVLSVIYSKIFSAHNQNDDTVFDVEHLAPKELMVSHINRLKNKDNIHYALPISSIGNLCLLPEHENRRKQDKTIYQDEDYLLSIENDSLTLAEIEKNYSFTQHEDLSWLENTEIDFDTLKQKYFQFLNVHFSRMKNKVVDTLYGNHYRN